MVKNIIPRPPPLLGNRVAKHARNAERAFDALFDFKPIQDKDLFWQPGFDKETNPFVGSHPLDDTYSTPARPVTKQRTIKDLKEQFEEGTKTDNRTRQQWRPSHSTRDDTEPGPGDPFFPEKIPEFPDIPPDIHEPVDKDDPDLDKDKWLHSPPWPPEPPCGEKDPITGITNPCRDAQIQIQTSKLRTQGKNGSADRKGRNWNHSRKKNHFRRRIYQRRYFGEL